MLGDASHSGARRSGRLLRRTSTALVLAVLVSAVAAFELDLGPRWLGWDYPSPVDEPVAVAPPPGLTLPDPVPAAAVAEETEAQDADPAAVRRAVGRFVRNRKLGRHLTVAVNQMSDGAPVYRHGADRVIPASTMKIVTTAAALEVLGADHRFRTTVVAGAGPRQIVLVGGGDPFLASRPAAAGEKSYPPRADIRTLATATARALRSLGRTRVRLRYDTSLFTGPSVSPAWEPSYVPDSVVSPISPLWVDEGRERAGMAFRSEDPARAAAAAFAAALQRQQITVRGRPRPALAPTDANQLAAVRSAPVGQIVQRILEVSDNEAAEVLFRHVAVGEGRPASFAGAAAAVHDVLTRLGVDLTGARIRDGSGLSRQNRLSAETLLTLLEVVASDEHPGLRRVATGLPVAGFSGSLAYRFDTGDDDGPGLVRAKTGTLSGVHGLAGYVTDRDGTVMSFVAIADRVRLQNTLDARATIDRLAAALAGCACAAAAG